MSLESGTDASTTAVEQTRLNQPDEKTATRVTTYDDRTEPEFAVECTEPPAVDCGQVSPSRTSEAFLWLTRQDQFVAGLLCCVALGLLGVHWYRMGLSETPRQVIERPDLVYSGAVAA